jgi:hypothetical protein
MKVVANLAEILAVPRSACGFLGNTLRVARSIGFDLLSARNFLFRATIPARFRRCTRREIDPRESGETQQ